MKKLDDMNDNEKSELQLKKEKGGKPETKVFDIFNNNEMFQNETKWVMGRK